MTPLFEYYIWEKQSSCVASIDEYGISAVWYGISKKAELTGKDCVTGEGVFIKGLRPSKGDEER